VLSLSCHLFGANCFCKWRYSFSFTIINTFLSYGVSRNVMNRFCHLVNKMIMLVQAKGNFPHDRDMCLVVSFETTEARSPLYAPPWKVWISFVLFSCGACVYEVSFIRIIKRVLFVSFHYFILFYNVLKGESNMDKTVSVSKVKLVNRVAGSRSCHYFNSIRD
jgi:hypothetical protein